MNSTENKKIADFKNLLHLLELERQTYTKAQISDGLLSAFSVVLRHLNRLSSADILALYPKQHSKHPKSGSNQLPSDEELNSMSLEQIEEVLANETSPRRLLEAIAVIRFHFPHGSLRSLANIHLLKEKIGTRIRNERAHLVISSAARRARRP